jgi:hypothetical protein
MKGLTLLASAAALTLAGACVYLSSQLGAEREHRRAAVVRAATLESQLEKLERQRIASATKRAPEPAERARAKPAVPVPAPVTQAESALGPGEERTGQNLQRKLFASASGQALLRANILATLKSQNPEIARRLNLTEAEGQKLLELLADQQLAQRTAHRFTGPDDFKEAMARDRREIAALLGEERARLYDQYKDGASDRQQVRSLRSRLGEVDALTDDQARSLAAGLQEEREQFGRELKDQFGDQSRFTMSSVSGGVFMSTGGTVDEDGQERDLVDQMNRYNRRMRDRASSVLTTRQLKVFTEMQEAQLAQQRVFLRSMRETVPAK